MTVGTARVTLVTLVAVFELRRRIRSIRRDGPASLLRVGPQRMLQ
jgi:hypothetical protein